MAEMLPGTISAMEEFMFSFTLFSVKYCLISLMQSWSYLILESRFFFSFLSSLTSLVRLTVSLFNFIMIVFLIVSSIFLNLLVFLTWLIKWSLFPVFTCIFSSFCSPSHSLGFKILDASSANTCLLWHLWKHSRTSEYEM